MTLNPMTPNPITGIHHITAIASDPQANVDFYHAILGQRLVKTTVNFDDPGTYHFYFADYTGSPGTVMTFFPWPNARRGQVGNGQVVASAYAIGGNSLGYWLERLKKFNVATGKLEQRFGTSVLPFEDRDGTRLELVVDDNAPEAAAWEDGPVPAGHALRGFHGVTLGVWQAEETSRLLTDVFGYTLVGQEGARQRFQGQPGSLGSFVDLQVDPEGPRGRPGAGVVHHVAFRNQNDPEQLAYQARITQAGYQVTPVRDRQYFHSIYFNEPNGILFELATNPPGFALDEPVESLGQSLRLPPWLEPQREVIANILPRFSARLLAGPEVTHA